MTRTRAAIPLLVAVVMLIAAPSALASAPVVGPLPAVEGTTYPATTVIATFDDGTDLGLGCNPASDYTATVDWGDGTTQQTATVAGPISPGFLQPCAYDVEAGHTYTEAGTYSVSVDVTGGGTPGTGSGTATVADAPLSAGTSIKLQATAAAAFSGTVANFTDGNAGAGAGDYTTVTIAWGDGSTSTGTVTATNTPGQFAVGGSHTYAQPGTYATSITVDDVDGSTVTIAGSASVAPAPLTAGTSIGLSATEGAQFSGTVAKFSDANPQATAGNYTATITWGDGSTSAGTVSATGTTGQFAVSGTHTFANAGNGTTSVKVDAADGATVTVAGSVSVADAALTAGSAATPSATEGMAFTGTVGTFTDANTSAMAAAYAGTISWGDSGSSTATITAASTPGQFSVGGTHTYASAGTFSISVAILDRAGSTVTLTGTATVGPPAINTVKTFGVTGTAGVATDVPVGVFTDTDPGTTAASYSATISWGDGTTGAGSVVTVGTTGEYGVGATHTYASSGTYTVNATVTAPFGRTFVLQTTATIGAPTPSSKPTPKPTAKPHLDLTLSHLGITTGPAVRAEITCPSGQASCLGRLSAYAQISGRKVFVGSVSFAQAGGRHGSYDIRFSAAMQRRLGHRRTVLTVSARADDPSNGESGSTTRSFSARI